MQRKTWRHLWKVHLSVSGKQTNSLKSCSELTSLILRLRIIRVPRFCNLNSLFKYVLSELDQTISQYLYKGWTIELCKYLQTSIQFSSSTQESKSTRSFRGYSVNMSIPVQIRIKIFRLVRIYFKTRCFYVLVSQHFHLQNMLTFHSRRLSHKVQDQK